MNFLLRLVGWALGLAVFAVLILVGGNIYNVVGAGRWTPPDQARQQLAKAGGLDLAGSQISNITAALGPPEYRHKSRFAVNADDYRWARGAVEAEAVGDDVIHLDIGASTLLSVLPLDRARFPGSFLGLRLGDPTPDAARAAQLRKAVTDCCGGFMGWRSSGGRVAGIYYRANTTSVPVH